MKKFTLTLIAVFGAAALFAHTSQLNLTIYGSPNMTVVFDGQHFPVYNNTVRIQNLNPGNHWIKIVKKQPYRYGNVAVYSGRVFIPASMKLFGIFDNRRGFRITEKYPVFNSSYNKRYKYKYYKGNYNNKYYNRNKVMNEYELENMLQTLANIRFESTRLEIATEALRTNLVTSAQVVEIVSMFRFESNKVEIAKIAYSSTVDKERYYLVYNAFSFDSSIRELKRYIHSYRF